MFESANFFSIGVVIVFSSLLSLNRLGRHGSGDSSSPSRRHPLISWVSTDNPLLLGRCPGDRRFVRARRRPLGMSTTPLLLLWRRRHLHFVFDCDAVIDMSVFDPAVERVAPLLLTLVDSPHPKVVLSVHFVLVRHSAAPVLVNWRVLMRHWSSSLVVDLAFTRRRTLNFDLDDSFRFFVLFSSNLADLSMN